MLRIKRPQAAASAVLRKTDMNTITFEVNDMSCGHCVSSITKAVQALDPGAQVQVDLGAHRVHIQSLDLAAQRVEALRAVIEEAGFTPVLL
jgi:copper chaperone